MGIPAYFSKIIKDYNIIFKDLDNKTECHNFFLDSNSIIYDIIYSFDDNDYDTIDMEKFETNIINNVCIKIDYYIKLINPRNKVYIMFDGVAPMAKIYQQKNRRYKSYITNNINTNNNNNISNNKWDTSSITPGTKFMKKLSIMINNYFKKNKNIIIS